MSLTPTLKLPIFSTIKYSWQKTYNAKGNLWGVMAITPLIANLAMVPYFLVLFYIIGHAALTIPPGDHEAFNQMLTENLYSLRYFIYFSIILFYVIYFVMLSGILRMGVLQAVDRPINIAEMFDGFPTMMTVKATFVYFLEVIFSLILAGIIIANFIGLFVMFTWWKVFAIVVGILFYYFVLRCSMILPALYVLNCSLWQAIKISFRITKSNVLRIFTIKILEAVIIVLSCIPLFIGVIWSVPFGLLVRGAIWRALYQEAI